MRHRKQGRKLGRTSSHRRALFRNLATALIVHEKVETTHAKAMELRGVVERLITKAARVSVANQSNPDEADKVRERNVRRQVAKFLPNVYVYEDAEGNEQRVRVVDKLFGELASRYKERPGGYTRVTRVRVRPGDAAPMSYIEFV